MSGILKEGFKPSKTGSFGPGVYLSNDYSTACAYGICYVNKHGLVKKRSYVFVNEVKQTEELQRRYKGENIFQDYLNKEPVMQTYGTVSRKQMILKEDTSQVKYDSSNNKMLDGTFNVDVNESHIVLAYHELVNHAYLIEIQEDACLKTIV